MKTINYFLLCCGWLLATSLAAQNMVTITDDDLQGGQTYNWTADNIYQLDGYVFLEAGGVLNIEAGTVIQGRQIPSGQSIASVLVIAAGAQINAIGTRSRPIIFTSEYDLLDCECLSPEDTGLWGGLLVLGNAPVGTRELAPTEVLEGFEPRDRTEYGGTDANDNSGVLRYVSIRYAGAEILPGFELSSISFYGVGAATTVEYVDVYAGRKDGFEFYGGTVRARYLVAAFCSDDAFDVDASWAGNLQFIFGWQASEFYGNMLEYDGARDPSGEPFTQGRIYNATLVGTDNFANESSSGLLLRDAGALDFFNSIIVNAGTAFSLEDNLTIERITAGETVFNGNIVDNSLQLFRIDDNITLDPTAAINDLTQGIENAPAGLNNVLLGAPLDPRPLPNSIATRAAVPPTTSELTTVDYRGAFSPTENWATGWTALADYGFFADGSTKCVDISGLVFMDENNNCTNDNEVQLASWKIEASNGTRLYHSITDSDGEFVMHIPPGDYQMRLLPPNDYWFSCNIVQDIAVDTNNAVRVEFGVSPLQECPALTVDLSTAFLRRCFERPYFVNYCNQGTIAAENAFVEVTLDSFLEYVGSSIPFSTQEGNTYTFALGIVGVNECGRFQIDVLTTCAAELGQTHCSEASIFPNEDCTPLPLAEIDVTSVCTNERMTFTLKNIGELGMTDNAKFIVIEDDVMLLEEPFQLNAGAEQVVEVAATGATYILLAPRFPAETAAGFLTAGSENCGGDGTEGHNGFLNNFPLAEDQFLARDCQENIGADDPNDKMAFPAGFSDENFLLKNTELEYQIRFQNTGTDTASNVRIEDVISENLDLASFEVGASSHDYRVEFGADRLVTFFFDNIMLPDSFANEPASNGFVRFKIQQQRDLDLGTPINNSADIYFDFNAPIRTTTVRQVIGEIPAKTVSSTGQIINNQNRIKVQPNPASERVAFCYLTDFALGATFTLYNNLGEVVHQRTINQPQWQLTLDGFAAGIYYFKVSAGGRDLESGVVVIAW